MRLFYCVKGFKNLQVVCYSKAEDVRTFIRAAQTPRLLDMYRRQGDHSAKQLLPCLIVGDHITGQPTERKDANYGPSDRILLDYDHDDLSPEAVAADVCHRLREAGLAHLIDCCYMERSCSGKFHMLAPRLTPDTAADIATYSRLLGLDFDTKVTNTSRLMALTGEPLLGSELENLMKSEEVRVKIEEVPVDSEETSCGGQTVNHQLATFNSPTYHGLAYEDIVAALIDELGGLPQVGDRNTFLYKAASELRTITDNAPAWIASLLEGWHYFGLPKDEALATIKSACRKSDPPRNTALLIRTLDRVATATFNRQSTDDNESNRKELSPSKGRSEASRGLAKCQAVPSEGSAVLCATEADRERRGYTDASSSTSTFTPFTEEPPTMPTWKELPTFVKTLCKNIPHHLIPHVLNTCEPALANYLCGTTATAIDGTLLHLGEGILAVSIAPPSTGKSSRRQPLEAINRRFRQQDIESRRAVDEWKELARRTKASDLPERPIMESHLLGADCTASALLDKLKALPTGALLITVDELQMLDGLKSNSSDNHTPLLLAFHSEELEVERSSEMGVSGCVAVRLNLSAMGTPYQAQTLFKNGWHSGLITRCQLSTIIDDGFDDDDFHYGSYEGYQEHIEPYIDLLTSAQHTTLQCRKADDHARQLRRQAIDLASLHSSDTLRILARRQAILAQKRAYLYWILAGRKWTPRLEAFLQWRFQYSLWATYNTLGHIIEAEQAAERASTEAASKKRGPQSWLTLLPDTFTPTDLQNLRRLKGADPSDRETSRLMAQWKCRGHITELPDKPGTWRKRV